MTRVKPVVSQTTLNWPLRQVAKYENRAARVIIGATCDIRSSELLRS